MDTKNTQETECGTRRAEDPSPPPWIPWRRAAPLFAVIVVIGALCTWQFARLADREMRERLLTESSMIGKAVNVRQVLSLTRPEATLASPDYLQIKNQLLQVRSANPACRFIYLMARRPDGTVFFLADSEPSESKDCSPLGQTYEEVSPQYLRVFTMGQSAVEGPLSDRWGTWVSGLVPVVDPQTKTLIAVLGMDVDARHWNRAIAARCVAPVAVTVLILFVLVVSFLIQNYTVLEHRRLASHEAMMASLAAACHHIGQPATILSVCLGVMGSQEMSPSMQDMIRECRSASDRITTTLQAFNHVASFKTEAYISALTPPGAGSSKFKERILAVDGM